MKTVAILPVKRLDDAKQRLSDELEPVKRRILAEAMISDVLDALGRVGSVQELIVVSDDPLARRLAEARGASILKRADRGHNDAAAHGLEAAVRAGAERALLIPGDCPLLEPAELEALLDRPVTAPSALIVPDRHGTGTNSLLLTPPGALAPSFGPGSCRRHLEHAHRAGVHAEVARVPSLALDVDTGEDFETVEAMLARTSSAASHTREALHRLGRAAA
jgi:2-phospho-L-lactate guanylyltransferase